MSQKNNHTARYNRERQKRQIRRQRSRDLRKALGLNQPEQATVSTTEADASVLPQTQTA